MGAGRVKEKSKSDAKDCSNVDCSDGGTRGGRTLESIIKLLYTNAQSIKNKVNLLKAHITESRPHLIAITESWTHEGIEDVQLKLEGYEIVNRCDRTDTTEGRGGGVLLYSSLPNVSSTVTQSEFHQHVAVTISSKNEPDLHLHLIYRSPNSSELNNSYLLEYVSKLPENVVLVGDFNCREIDWCTLSVDAPDNSFSQRFLESTQDKFLYQHVDFPTNLTPQKDGSITETCIDLLFTDNADLVASVKSTGHLGKSKHVILEAELRIPTKRNDTVELVPDFKKANFNTMKDHIAAFHWNEILNNMDTEEAWDTFKANLHAVIEDSIPKKKRRHSNRPLWMNQNVMRIIRKKRRLWRWYCQTSDYEDYQSYHKTCAVASKAVRKAKRNLERKLARDIKSNPKPFYKYLNSNTKSRSKVGPLKDKLGNLQTDDQEMVGILNETFSSVFTTEDMSKIPVPEQLFSGNAPLSDVTVTEEMVLEKLNALDPNKSPGPDQIHPTIAKELADVLASPLMIIFNKSLQEGVVPKDWKLANVTSIFKKGDRTEGCNYRPISLTSIVCKILESLLRDAIMNHLAEHDLIRCSQHGFMPRRSCLTNLLEYLEEVTKLIDAGHRVDIMYLDFSRAFDKVPHHRLLLKVRSLGVTDKIAAWIENWLKDREQRVVLNGKNSDWSNVTSGVPQGSVLGPCLFVMFINDIEAAIDTVMTVKKFADDTKLCGIANNVTECLHLHHQLDKLYKWSVDWQMLFNMDKCKVIHLGSENIEYEYTMGGQCLKKVNTEKDLGVHIHQSLTPSMHIAEAVKKANQVLGQLLHAISYRDKHNFMILYKQRVRCHLEYAVQCWNPWLKHDIDLMEGGQKRAVRGIQGLHGNYEDKLKQIGLPTLVERRTRGDMIQTFKIVNKIDDVNPNTWFSFASDVQRPTRNTVQLENDGSAIQRLTLKSKNTRLNLRKYFFSNRVVEPWNALPETLKRAKSINCFKRGYDELHGNDNL